MRRIEKKSCAVIFCCFLVAALFAQNLEKIGKKDMVTLSGGMNFNSVFYNAQGFEARRDPFTWYFNGNLTLNILEVNLPFTYSYSNLHGTFTQPFNMQSCSPKYKWAQAHVGTTSMNFSSYTLAGHVFTGGGLELKPEGFYFGAMYGRLSKAVAYDAIGNSSEGMSYKRMGGAVKIGFEKNGNVIGATYFTAKDDPGSLTFVPPGTEIYPAQNTAVSISGKINLWKCINAEGEAAYSGLTRNIFSGSESVNFSGLEKWLLPTKSTTQFFKAYKFSIAYSGKTFSVSANHEHTDPDYETFGGYYFNNDLESWTIAPAFRFCKGKCSIALNTGLQRNNLDASKLNTTRRWVGAVNVSITPSPGWLFAGSYSNFTAFTNHRLPTDPFWQASPADTLSFYQVTQQGNVNLVHSFGNKRIRQTVALISSCQVSEVQQNSAEQAVTTVLNGNLAWSLQFTSTKTTVSLIGNYNRSETGMQPVVLFGPGLQFSQALKNGIRITGGSVYNRSLADDQLTGHVMNHRAQLSWTPKMKREWTGKPSLGVNAVYVDRLAVTALQHRTGELTATVNLGVNF